MRQNKDASHETNANHFEALVLICENLGGRYNPPSNLLKAATLRTQLVVCRAAIDAVTAAKEALDLATRNRRAAIDSLLPLATRVTGNFAASDVSDAAIEHIKDINKKIQKGIEHHDTPAEGETETEGSSTRKASQQSIDYKIAHWDTLLQALALEPSYQPSEMELTLPQLEQLMEDVHALNTSVLSKDLTCTAQRIARDKALYEDKIGLCDIAQRVKNYLKSTLGASSEEYKAANKLKFYKREFAETATSTIPPA